MNNFNSAVCRTMVFLVAASVLSVQALAQRAGDAGKDKTREEYALEVEHLRKDRDNLLKNSKRLVREIGQLKSVREEYDTLREERNALIEVQKSAADRLTALNEEVETEKKTTDASRRKVEELKQLQAELARERDRLGTLLVDAKVKTGVDKLELTIRTLENEKNKLSDQLVKSQKAITRWEVEHKKERAKLEARLSKTIEEQKKEIEGFERRLAELQKKYDNAVKENKALGRELVRLPGKFTEVARENRRLAQATADRHYNLGVFYARNGQHERAIAEFEETLRIEPDYAYAHYNLGHIYAKYLVDKEKSVKYFREYLKVSPDAADKDLVRRYIVTWEVWTSEQGE